MHRPPPRPPAELAGRDGDHLDPRLAEQGVGVGVAVVTDDDARLERDHVVAVVPLLAHHAEPVATGVDHAEGEAEGRLQRGQQTLVLPPEVDAGRRGVVGTQAVGHDRVRHRGVRRHQVDVREREHRVEVHRRPRAWQPGRDDVVGRPGLEQRLRHLDHGLVRGALAHADQHDTLAERHHVAALEGREPVVPRAPVEVAQPHVVRRVRERRVEPVDGRRQQGLLATGRPVHRVQRDALEDPRRVVSGEQGVGQRRQHEPLLLGGVAQGEHERPGKVVGHVAPGDTADEQLGQPGRGQLVQPGPQLAGDPRPHQVVGDLPVEHPGPTLACADHVGQHRQGLQDLDVAVAHLGDELVVVPLGAVHPDHIVEQQVVTRVRGEPEVGQPRRAHQYPP